MINSTHQLLVNSNIIWLVSIHGWWYKVHYNPIGYHNIIWLVVDLPLWKIWTSNGIIVPNWMESHKIHVPNHQPDIQLDRDIPQFREVGYILLHDYPMIIMIIPIILVTNTDSWSLSCQWTIYIIYIYTSFYYKLQSWYF